jgi:hypothetical protein
MGHGPVLYAKPSPRPSAARIENLDVDANVWAGSPLPDVGVEAAVEQVGARAALELVLVSVAEEGVIAVTTQPRISSKSGTAITPAASSP